METKKITQDSFVINTTDKGRFTVRWKHNWRAIKTVETRKQVEQYIDFLVDWFSKNGVEMDGKWLKK